MAACACGTGRNSMNVLFEPHHDDAVLFACYTLLRYRPLVVTVFGEDNERFQESVNAMAGTLGVPYQASFLSRPREAMGQVEADVVWAPMLEEGAHEQHNEVSRMASEMFGDRCLFYATYKRGHGRTRTDNEVTPEPDWYALKLKAMACYTSQINHPHMRPWFNDWEREWMA